MSWGVLDIIHNSININKHKGERGQLILSYLIVNDSIVCKHGYFVLYKIFCIYVVRLQDCLCLCDYKVFCSHVISQLSVLHVITRYSVWVYCQLSLWSCGLLFFFSDCAICDLKHVQIKHLLFIPGVHYFVFNFVSKNLSIYRNS